MFFLVFCFVVFLVLHISGVCCKPLAFFGPTYRGLGKAKLLDGKICKAVLQVSFRYVSICFPIIQNQTDGIEDLKNGNEESQFGSQQIL